MRYFLNRIFRNNMYKISSALISGMSEIITKSNPATAVGEKNYETVSSAEEESEEIMRISKEEINQMIATNSIIIFSKTKCPYCKMAKEVFDKLKKKYQVVELDQRDDGDEIQSILGELTGARTVPRVFVNGECLGGGTDVKRLYDSGELAKKF